MYLGACNAGFLALAAYLIREDAQFLPHGRAASWLFEKLTEQGGAKKLQAATISLQLK